MVGLEILGNPEGLMKKEEYGFSLCLVHDEDDDFGTWTIPAIKPVVEPKVKQAIKRKGRRRVRNDDLEKEVLEVLDRLSAIFRVDPRLSQIVEINLNRRDLAREWKCAPQQVEQIVRKCFMMLKHYWQEKPEDVIFADQEEMVFRVRNICHDFGISTFEELIQLAKELNQSEDPISLDGL